MSQGNMAQERTRTKLEGIFFSPTQKSTACIKNHSKPFKKVSIDNVLKWLGLHGL